MEKLEMSLNIYGRVDSRVEAKSSIQPELSK